MFFLNLSLGEFLTLLGAVSGIVTALYLLDRAKRKKVVSTLRFWTPALTADDQQSRKRMHDPWSLILQLISLLLLLLAIAQLQWGTRERSGRDHVLLLDTSSWTAEQSSQGTVLDREKQLAAQYIGRLPARDRVLVATVDGLATPITPFLPNRSRLMDALSTVRSSFAALNIEQALTFARQAHGWSGGQTGDIVYVGPQRIDSAEQPSVPKVNLRIITVPVDLENCGIRRVSVRRAEDDPSTWQANVSLKNYGLVRRTLRLQTQFAGSRFAPRTITLAPGQEAAIDYTFTTSAAGQLITSLDAGDRLPSDDRVTVQLPKSGMLRLAVFTVRPEVLRPLLSANHRLSIRLMSPAEYSPHPAADVMLLDQMEKPAHMPAIPSFWIAPVPDRSPLPVKQSVQNTAIKAWHADNPIGSGLHAKDTRIPAAEVFETFEGDILVGSIAEGPVVVARAGDAHQPKLAAIGFDPLSGPFRFEITTPLLFANILRWLEPEALRTFESNAATVGVASITLDPEERVDRLRLIDQSGDAVPFAVHQHGVQFFAERPSIVRLISDDRERVLSLTIPDVASYEWKTPATAHQGLPLAGSFKPSSVDLWKWLAFFGGLGLLCEWLIFGHQRPRPAKRRQPRTARPERELVSK